MKAIIYKVLYITSLLLTLAFVVFVVLDACFYNSMFTSAPFYAFVLVRVIEFLIPAAIVFAVARLFHKSCKSKGN